MSLLAISLPEMIGLTILHSLWQITLLWIILVAVLRLSPKAPSQLRYTFAISTLILSVLTTAGTALYLWQWQSHVTVEEVSTLSSSTSKTMDDSYVAVRQDIGSTVVNTFNTIVPILAWLWFAGLLAMGTRFVGSLYYVGKLRTQKNLISVSPFLQQELKRLSIDLGLRCDVAIATSTRISSPLTLGSSSPIILLPIGLLTGLSTAQIEAILVHELYHIKRRDYILNICQALVEVLLFYHPALWHINKMIREERENCCDDKTVEYCGNAISYARALTQIQELNTLIKPPLAISAGGPDAGSFSNRIKRLFKIYPDPVQARFKGLFAIGFLMFYLGIAIASASVATVHRAGPEEKPIKKSGNHNDTLSNVFADTTPVADLVAFDKMDIAKKPGTGVKMGSMNVQLVDTIVREQSLDKCLKQVKSILMMASMYQNPGALAFSELSGEDSLNYLAGNTFKLQPIQFSRSLNLLRIGELGLTHRMGNMTTDSVLEQTHRSSEAAGTSGEELTKGVAHVFPNSTDGTLNVRFTPARRNSHVKMVLVDTVGKVVKEVTDSTYDDKPIELHVDLSGYPKGVYVLQINIDGAKSQQRVVVE